MGGEGDDHGGKGHGEDREGLPRPGEPYPPGSDRPYEHERVEGDEPVGDGVFLRVLARTSEVAAGSGYPYAFIGGIASAVLGRERWTHDIDLMVRPGDARGMLRRFAAAGFATEERDHAWLYKAYSDGVTVDLIFRIMVPNLFAGAIVLDDQMLARVREADFHGARLALVSPEDLLIIKVLVHKEFRSRHWFDGLGLIAAGGLDWDYLIGRALERNPRRVLSLLLYAQSDGLDVPERVIRDLVEHAGIGRAGPEPAGTVPAVAARPGGRAEAGGRVRMEAGERERDGGGAEPDAYLVGRLLDRFARDHRTAELEVDVELEQDEVILTGNVATPERRAALTEVAAAVLPGRRVRNLVSVAGQPPAPTVERVGRGG